MSPYCVLCWVEDVWPRWGPGLWLEGPALWLEIRYYGNEGLSRKSTVGLGGLQLGESDWDSSPCFPSPRGKWLIPLCAPVFSSSNGDGDDGPSL